MGESRKGRIKKGRDLAKWKNNRPQAPEGYVRIIGGSYRGVSLIYSGDKVTRPMKDSVREALFNLVGGFLQETIAFDLFAGTGVVGLESLSRGSNHAVLVERHVPTTKIIRQNVETVDVNEQVSICGSDSFFWVRQFVKQLENQKSEVDKLTYEQLRQVPWAVFCCPPYDLFVDKTEQLLEMLESLIRLSPPNSLFVVESDERFDTKLLATATAKIDGDHAWDRREYSPAIISLLKMDIGVHPE